MEGPESWLNVEPLHVFFCFPVNQLFFFCELQAVLTRRTSTFLLRQTSRVLDGASLTVLNRATLTVLTSRTSSVLVRQLQL